MAKCCAQCYDGASAMSSKRVGVAKHVLDACLLAPYYHCASHSSNLSCNLLDKVPVCNKALKAVKSVTTFLQDGAKRQALLSQAQSMVTEEGQRRLVKLCATRFVERHECVDVFWNQLSAIILALEMMSGWTDSTAAGNARTNKSLLANADTLVGLEILQQLKPMAAELQRPTNDLVKAMSLVTRPCPW